MSEFAVKTIWAWRDEGPELLEAWDEYSIDQNQEGWEQAKRKVLAEVNADGSGFWREAGVRVVDLKFDFDKIEALFLDTEVEAEAVPEDA